MTEKIKEKLVAIGIVTPSLIAVLIFVYGFIGKTVNLSFLDQNDFIRVMSGESNFVGLKNYIQLFSNSRFHTNLWNTLYFTLFFILGCLIVGIFLSLILDEAPRGGFIFQNIYLFPMAISFVVTGTVWRWIFSPGSLPNRARGLNLLFEKIDLTSFQWEWFTSTSSFMKFNLALIPIIVAAVWQFSGYTMAMWLAGLRGIDQQLIEAARIDGASKWQVFTKILFPIQKPITLSAVIVLAHVSLKAFALIYSMTGSGPKNVTDIPAVYMYESTFKAHRYSYGASIAIMLLLMVGVFIVPYLVNSFKKEGS
ncbi:MAG: carbohydrate ABC transporter permease [Halanaerobiaceae bacterium]